MIKPFCLIKEKETDECDEDNKFTAPSVTAVFGRYDNESPPFTNIFFKITKRTKEGKKFFKNLKVF